MDLLEGALAENFRALKQFMEDEPYVLGDVDGDGVIRAADALLALRLAIGDRLPTQRELHAGDINGNGSIDSADASMILFYAAHRAWPVPAPQALASARTMQAAASVRLSSAQAQQGTNVLIALGADNLTQVAGGAFVIAHDTRVVESVVKVTKTGLAANFTVAFTDTGNGLLSIALSSNAPIDGTGDLVTLELKLRSNATVGASPLTLAGAHLNDLYGRDFVTSFANNTLTRQSGVITVTPVSTNRSLYLPLVSQK